MDLPSKIASVEKPEGPNIKQKLLELYSELGEQLGFASLIEGGGVSLLWKKKDDAPLQPTCVAFEIQFGNRGELEESARRLSLSGADFCVLVSSSASRSYSQKELFPFILSLQGIQCKAFMLHDIETGQHRLVSESRPKAQAPPYAQEKEKPPRHMRQGRRKRIIGKKGMHKVQD